MPNTGTSPYRYGGPGSLIIKIEIDGWERGNRIPTSGSPSRDYGEASRFGWVHGTGQGSDSHVLWPFDPEHPFGNTGDGPLQTGEYVRIVGTLWEDQEHDSSGTFSLSVEHATNARSPDNHNYSTLFNYAHHMAHSWVPKRVWGVGYRLSLQARVDLP